MLSETLRSRSPNTQIGDWDGYWILPNGESAYVGVFGGGDVDTHEDYVFRKWKAFESRFDLNLGEFSKDPTKYLLQKGFIRIRGDLVEVWELDEHTKRMIEDFYLERGMGGSEITIEDYTGTGPRLSFKTTTLDIPESKFTFEEIVEALSNPPVYAEKLLVEYRLVDMYNNTAKIIKRRAGDVSVQPLGFDPTTNAFKFRTGSVGGKKGGYTTTVAIDPQKNTKEILAGPIAGVHMKTRCSCPSSRYWGHQVLAKRMTYLQGKPVGSTALPKRNLRYSDGTSWQNSICCKHLLAAVNYLLQMPPSGWQKIQAMINPLSPARPTVLPPISKGPSIPALKAKEGPKPQNPAQAKARTPAQKIASAPVQKSRPGIVTVTKSGREKK